MCQDEAKVERESKDEFGNKVKEKARNKVRLGAQLLVVACDAPQRFAK
jgi:hypothetical protein